MPADAPPRHSKPLGRIYGVRATGKCFQHENRRAVSVVNGREVCRECLQLVVDVYHWALLEDFREDIG